MSLLIAEHWKDFALLDGGDGLKQERWGDIVLVRPDPQIIWPWPARNATHPPAAPGAQLLRAGSVAGGPAGKACEKYDAIYRRNESGGGRWEFKRPLPESWTVRYRELTFIVRPTRFKHLGLFPEQAVNWDWLAEKISAEGGLPACPRRLGSARELGQGSASGGKSQKQSVTLLNLFGYTGAATIAAAKAGATVCHVDAAAGMVAWCRQNAALNGLPGESIRYIVDDCMTFVKREIRRGKRYDALVMDPPSFGRGRRGEVWKLEDQLWTLLVESRKLLSERPLLFLVNCYTAHLSALVLANMLSQVLAGLRGEITSGELGLPFRESSLILPCGIFARWER